MLAVVLAPKLGRDDVPVSEKKRRLGLIEELQEGIARDINARLLDKSIEVLIEDRKQGKWRGRTRTDKLVFALGSDNQAGQTVNIRVEKTSPWSLTGRIEK